MKRVLLCCKLRYQADTDVSFLQCESPAGIRSNGKVQASIRYPNGTIADKVEKPAKRGELNVMCTSDGKLFQ